MGNIISSSDYTGTPLEKAFIPNSLNENSIRKELKLKLEKGVIDQPLYDNAVKELETILEKAGEGKTKQEDVIGETSSGKSIYKDGKHSNYANFHENDHYEAARHHSTMADKENTRKFAHDRLHELAKGEGNKEEAKDHFDKMKDAEDREKHHTAQAQYHRTEAQPSQYRDRDAEISKRVSAIKKS